MSVSEGLTKLSAVELARRIATGETSASEALEAHLRKIEELTRNSTRLSRSTPKARGRRPLRRTRR